MLANWAAYYGERFLLFMKLRFSHFISRDAISTGSISSVSVPLYAITTAAILYQRTGVGFVYISMCLTDVIS